MKKKYFVSLVFSLAFLLLANNQAGASDTCSLGETCTDTKTNSCKWCSVSNKYSGNAGYVKGGKLVGVCSSASCTMDAACWTSSGTFSSTAGSINATAVDCCPSDATHCPTPPTCKVRACTASNTCTTADAPNGTSCGTAQRPMECYSGTCVDTPSCTANGPFTVDSGEPVNISLSASGVDKYTASCTNYQCSNYVCNYTGTTQTYPEGSITNGTISSTMTHYNTSATNKTRACTFRFYNSARPSLTTSCTQSVTVKPGDPPPNPTDPSCSAWNGGPIASGGSYLASVSAANANTWKATCTDFSCSNYICDYSAGKTQNYSGGIIGTAFSSTSLFANNQYYNSSGSTKTRTCNFEVWNSADPTKIGKCTGTTSVSSGIPKPITEPGCVGYTTYLNSGETVTRSVSASNSDSWSAVCSRFSCGGYKCTYNSPTYTQNYGPYPFPLGEGTIMSNNLYTNKSNSTQTRTCNYKVWNSAEPDDKKTCTGKDVVCAEGYKMVGTTCVDCSGNDCSCISNNSCNATALAGICTYDSCWNGCNYVSGTKSCVIPTLNFRADNYNVASGYGTTVRWNTTNVRDCWGTTPSGTGWHDTDGVEATGPLTASTTYEIECWASNGRSTGKKNVTIAVAGNPVGVFESATCANGIINVNGWAYDPDVSSQSIDVHFYKEVPLPADRVFLGGCSANQYDLFVNNTEGIIGNHRFSCDTNTTPLPDGTYDISAWGINNSGTGNPEILPRQSVTCCTSAGCQNGANYCPGSIWNETDNCSNPIVCSGGTKIVGCALPCDTTYHCENFCKGEPCKNECGNTSGVGTKDCNWKEVQP
ncbi:MAG: hypothetical protein WA055_00465 [Candidatus Moraniibacteriota bacterium]